jgi:predicted PurR-regulated permease PerM
MKHSISKHTFLIFFTAIALLSLFIIWPLFTAILAGILIAYIFYPLHKRIKSKVSNKNVAACTSTILILLVVTIPFVVLLGAITADISDAYAEAKLSKPTTGFFQEECTGSLCEAKEKIDTLVTTPTLLSSIQESLGKISQWFVQYSSSFVFSIPQRILELFIMVFVMFYGFRDGEGMIKKLYTLIPLRESFKKHLKQQTSDVIYATVYGILIVGLIQGFLATIGYFIFGLASPLMWGALTTLAAIIPFVGPPMIWFPAGVVQIIRGMDAGNSLLTWQGIGLLLYGTFIISTIDNLLKPKIIGQRSKVHPAVILVGLFGGLISMGPIGLVVGPLVLAMLVSFIRVYEKDKKQILN